MAFLLQSRRATEVPVQRRFPMWKAPHDACGPVRVNVNSYFQFCSILSARSHTDQTCWPTPSVCFVLVLSLSDIGLPPCISVSGLLCQLFVFCRSQCEQGPIPIFLVMLPQPFLSLYSVLYKILHFCHFSSVEACSP